ncbi:hypothetical protein [Allosalinactinospora lopnorensis]|uniref:hypothetical protein n=1 Tax=Allosalinactinospora lopnorensis TaxID=1352348 RepID=UPI000623C670|nr:hypothetical protein [Allosalinactinospora lopnorensis]
MHLDSCRDLKRSLLERVPELTARTEAPWVGLGVTRIAPGEFSLAVRVPNSRTAADLIERLASEAHNELNVVTVGRIRALSAPSPDELQKRHRPLVPGASVGHPDITAGTLGAFVTIDEAPHILSNNHVLADSGRAEPGDTVLQPGVSDSGTDPGDAVARLTAFSELRTDRPNLLDAAVARIDDSVGHDPEGYPGGAITDVTAEVQERDEVRKLGRTTGYTRGYVTAFEVDGLRIDFPTGDLLFDDQIEISGAGGGFSDGGDSGSLIWTADEHAALGLLFAGSDIGGPDGTGLTYANPMRAVLDEFDARLADGR